MRVIELSLITETVAKMAIDANCNIDQSILERLENALKVENQPSKFVLEQIIENDKYAREEQIPICQDTGIVTVFLEIGYECCFQGDVYQAINEGIKKGYVEGFLRKSVVDNPFTRLNTQDNTPAIIHTKLVPGDKIKITLAPKGAGSENMSRLKMLNPADGIKGIKDFVIETVALAKGRPCPPIIVGVGIGGNFEKCACLAKEALLLDINQENNDPQIAKIEHELLSDINNLSIGPMGLGGKTTALAVKIKTFACHIASLPVAVNIQCHVARHIEVVL